MSGLNPVAGEMTHMACFNLGPLTPSGMEGSSRVGTPTGSSGCVDETSALASGHLCSAQLRWVSQEAPLTQQPNQSPPAQPRPDPLPVLLVYTGSGTSLAVQKLILCASNTGGMCLIPSWATRIPHDIRRGQTTPNK